MMTGITSDYLDRVLAHVASVPSCIHEILAQDLRAAFPERHISVCNDDDIPARLAAAAENGVCRIYYVASGAHCLNLTNDMAAATGIVVALREEGDEDE